MEENQQKHPLETFMSLTMDNIKNMVEVDTVIGKPMEAPDGSMIVPLSKVKFGFASGGSEFVPENQKSGESDTMIPFGGGSGGGVSITPTAFLVAKKDGIQLLSVNETANVYEKMIEKSPQFMEKLNDMLKKNKENKENTDEKK